MTTTKEREAEFKARWCGRWYSVRGVGVSSTTFAIFVPTLASGEFVNYSITVIRMNSWRLIEGFQIATSLILREALPGAGQVPYVTSMKECTGQACIVDSNEMGISHELTWKGVRTGSNTSQITGPCFL